MSNFHYYAIQYVDDWFRYDRLMVAGINSKVKDKQVEALQAASSYYGVGRTLHKTDAEKAAENSSDAEYRKIRLVAALELLRKATLEDGAIAAVDNLTGDLSKVYKQNALSAASKFLWLKFRSPIVIYDTLAHNALKQMNASRRDYQTYALYHDAWRSSFARHREAIVSACEALRSVKRFTCVSSAAELASLTSDSSFTSADVVLQSGYE